MRRSQTAFDRGLTGTQHSDVVPVSIQHFVPSAFVYTASIPPEPLLYSTAHRHRPAAIRDSRKGRSSGKLQRRPPLRVLGASLLGPDGFIGRRRARCLHLSGTNYLAWPDIRKYTDLQRPLRSSVLLSLRDGVCNARISARNSSSGWEPLPSSILALGTCLCEPVNSSGEFMIKKQQLNCLGNRQTDTKSLAQDLLSGVAVVLSLCIQLDSAAGWYLLNTERYHASRGSFRNIFEPAKNPRAPLCTVLSWKNA
ncbi:hypothetical protein C8Q73DRAFT_130543 [Cubamyces lactineus]|nr:hypothetical protein C8Q73DRAFT_130543 [Cubamyces lactineus]